MIQLILFSRAVENFNSKNRNKELPKSYAQFSATHPSIESQLKLFNESNDIRIQPNELARLGQFYRMYREYLRFMVLMGAANNHLQKFQVVEYCWFLANSQRQCAQVLDKSDVTFYFKMNFLLIVELFAKQVEAETVASGAWEGFELCVKMFVWYISLEDLGFDSIIKLIFQSLEEVACQKPESQENEKENDVIEKCLLFYHNQREDTDDEFIRFSAFGSIIEKNNVAFEILEDLESEFVYVEKIEDVLESNQRIVKRF